MEHPSHQISVILPAYNRESSITDSITSVLQQTHSPMELIVVDDGSTDSTPTILRRIRDPRLRVITLERNQGACAARNRGIREARGTIIGFQDSDDLWEPDKLRRQIHVLKKAPGSVGVIYSGFWHVEAGRKSYRPSGPVRGHEGMIHPALLRGNFVAMPTTLVRRECFERVGYFDESLPRFQDWEMFLRIAKHYEFRFISDPLVAAHHTAGAISTSNQARIFAIASILKTHAEDFTRDPKLWSHYQYMLGTWRCLSGDVVPGRRNLAAAFRADPRRLRNSAALMTSLLGSRAYRWVFARRSGERRAAAA